MHVQNRYNFSLIPINTALCPSRSLLHIRHYAYLVHCRIYYWSLQTVCWNIYVQLPHVFRFFGMTASNGSDMFFGLKEGIYITLSHIIQELFAFWTKAPKIFSHSYYKFVGWRFDRSLSNHRTWGTRLMMYRALKSEAKVWSVCVGHSIIIDKCWQILT